MSEVIGKVRGLGQLYVNGLERQEVHIPKEEAESLPYREGARIEIDLLLGDYIYKAGLRATKSKPSIWICPDLLDRRDRKVNLAEALAENGFKKNQPVRLRFTNANIRLEPTPASTPSSAA